MNREQLLLMQAAEECAEIAVRCSKAQRFGMEEAQQGQALTNRERIREEVLDLLAVLELLEILPMGAVTMRIAIARKQDKVFKYLAYSRERGVLVE